LAAGLRTSFQQVPVPFLEHVHRDYPDAFATATFDLNGFFRELGYQIAAFASFIHAFHAVKVRLATLALDCVI
jgi:hypothetical protein